MYIPRNLDTLEKSTYKDKGRDNLTRIYIERNDKGRPFAYASDARQLVVTTWTEPEEQWLEATPVNNEPVEGFAASVTPEELKSCVDEVPRKHTVSIYEWGVLEEDGVVLKSSDGETVNIVKSEQPDKHNPPNWRKALPQYKRTQRKTGKLAVTVLVNPALLVSVLHQVQKLSGVDKNKAVALTVPLTGKAPIIVEQAGEGRSTVGALMPIIGDLSKKSVLEFMHKEGKK